MATNASNAAPAPASAATGSADFSASLVVGASLAILGDAYRCAPAPMRRCVCQQPLCSLHSRQLAAKDSRGGVWEVAGDPRDRASFQFGPLSTDCKKVAQERFWSVVGSHWDFWLPFSLTAYVFAPFMGVMFYCMLKGSKFFGDCLDRVTTGADIKSVLLRMYKGRPDPWAGRAPEENK